jgi:hypothetical protein
VSCRRSSCLTAQNFSITTGKRGSTVQTPQDPKDLEIIAQAVRSQGFVCARPSYLRLVGMTERGEQVRLVCNAETLQYRMTMSPDRKHITIRPWSE